MSISNTKALAFRFLGLYLLASILTCTSWSKSCRYEVEIKNQLINFLSDFSEKSIISVELNLEYVGVKTSYDYRGDGGVQSNIAVPLTAKTITNQELSSQNNKLFFISRDFPSSMYPYFACPAPKSLNITVGVNGQGQEKRTITKFSKQSQDGSWTSPHRVINIKLL